MALTESTMLRSVRYMFTDGKINPQFHVDVQTTVLRDGVPIVDAATSTRVLDTKSPNWAVVQNATGIEAMADVHATMTAKYAVWEKPKEA